MLFAHGANDIKVPPEESEQMYDACEPSAPPSNSRCSTTMVTKIAKRENQAVLTKAMCDWLVSAFGPTHDV
ncbi:hypothetical protein CQY20_29205 [Mycolicibacterium agri]|uniref:Peptidase S9 prolyl oligopeptidase catalytic domain-containing protein n=1 Tax=Mycolicibacterium agri TaxID=36811 RepID=A0A2A7MPM4_MYCAG|nr:hypothetical protein CQY20_29205 [Mycolicibacterium agri]